MLYLITVISLIGVLVTLMTNFALWRIISGVEAHEVATNYMCRDILVIVAALRLADMRCYLEELIENEEYEKAREAEREIKMLTQILDKLDNEKTTL